MNIKNVLIAIVSSFLLSSSAYATTHVIKNTKRLVEVLGVVDGSALQQAKQLEELSTKSKETITILINSPGGDVLAGSTFIDAMESARSRGVRLECIVGILAASMAYMYLPHCDERIVLRNTKLLWHPMKVGGFFFQVNAEQARKIAEDMDELEKPTMQALKESMGIDGAIFERAYRDEKMWLASVLAKVVRKGWLTVVDRVDGVNVFKVEPDENSPGMQQKAKATPNIPGPVQVPVK